MIYFKHALLRVVTLRKDKHEKSKSDIKKVKEKTKIRYNLKAKGCSHIRGRLGALRNIALIPDYLSKRIQIIKQVIVCYFGI